jgi:hypothetical protein
MSNQRKPLQNKVHPIWRGIGCFLMILIPLIAFGVSELIIGYLLVNNPIFAQNFTGNNLLYLRLGGTALLSVIIYLLFSIVSSVIYVAMGGSENEQISSRIGSGKRR